MKAASDTVDPVAPHAPHALLPMHACDTHAHVFGPYDEFPLTYRSSYAPPLAPAALHAAMLATVGMGRGVLVQPAPYGCDVKPMLDALGRSTGRLRGVAVAGDAVTPDTLRAWALAGVKGLRFVEMRDPQGERYPGSVGTDRIRQLAPVMRELGWHAQLWAPVGDYLHLLPELLPLGIPLVLDHMACLDVKRGVDDRAFQNVLSYLRQGSVWVKLSVCRVSRQSPAFADLKPYHDALIAANSGRLLWGSDWPFVRMGDSAPDVGALLDLFYEWVPDASVRQRILVDNPALLYGF